MRFAHLQFKGFECEFEKSEKSGEMERKQIDWIKVSVRPKLNTNRRRQRSK